MSVIVFFSTEHKMQENEHSMNTNTFPMKLWQMVNNDEISAIVWNDRGDGIIVHKKLIDKDFLTMNGFRASTFSSFARQLNIHGFRKSVRLNRETANTLHCFQANFQKDRPELLPLLRRGIKTSRPCEKEALQKDQPERWRNHRNLGETGDSVR